MLEEFEHLEKLYTEYYGELRAKNIPFNTDIATHVSTKLKQLRYFCSKVTALEESNRIILEKISIRLAARRKPFKGTTSGLPKSSFELQLFTEAFYYFAFRLIIMLNKHIPGFKNFECMEITLVRNKLLEHPESKDSQIYINSFSSGGKYGPIIKGPRYTHQNQKFIDKGLFYNTEKFLEKMKTKLLSEIRKVKST